MLAALREIRCRRDLRVTAVGHDTGPLADALRDTGIPLEDFRVRDPEGRRRSRGELLAQLRSIVDRIQPDLLHANSLAMARLTGAAAASPDWRIPCSGHLRDIIRVSRRAMDELNRNAALVAVSDATRDFHGANGLDPERVRTIPNGVDTDVFRPADRRPQRTDWFPGIPPSATLLMCIGQICLRKAQTDVAQATTDLIRDGHDLHLAVVGRRFSDKPESREFERQIRRIFGDAGCGDRLHLTGQRTDVPDLMRVADCLVHAAKQEPFGRVLLEAAASALPIVASRVGGTPEMLRQDVDAILFDPETPQALGNAIRRTLADRQAAQRRAQSARHRVVSHFRVPRTAERLVAFWHSLAAGAVEDAGGGCQENRSNGVDRSSSSEADTGATE